MIAPSPVDPLLLLLLALVADAVMGDVRWILARGMHPVELLGALIGFLETRLNRESRAPAARRMRGGLVVIAVTALAALVGIGVLAVTRGWPWGWVIEVLLAALLLAQRSLFDHVAAVGRALKRGGLAGGRAAVRHIVGRDPDSLDEHGVARAAVESLAENFSDAVVAPAFWYVLLGLPGLCAYKAINTLDSMIGHRSPRFLDFGHWAARLDTAVNFVPARLSGVILAAAALFTPTASGAAAFRVMRRDAAKHRSVNAGWPEGAMAGALGLALAGPRRYGVEIVDDPWIGDGRARVEIQDIRRALFLFTVACLIQVGLIAALASARGAVGP